MPGSASCGGRSPSPGRRCARSGELANAGPTSVDLGGHGLCDSDDSGSCNLVGVIRFPAGTTLAPGEHLLIVGNKESDAGVGPFTDCLAVGGPATCFYAPWKVSA